MLISGVSSNEGIALYSTASYTMYIALPMYSVYDIYTVSCFKCVSVSTNIVSETSFIKKRKKRSDVSDITMPLSLFILNNHALHIILHTIVTDEITYTNISSKCFNTTDVVHMVNV